MASNVSVGLYLIIIQWTVVFRCYVVFMVTRCNVTVITLVIVCVCVCVLLVATCRAWFGASLNELVLRMEWECEAGDCLSLACRLAIFHYSALSLFSVQMFSVASCSCIAIYTHIANAALLAQHYLPVQYRVGSERYVLSLVGLAQCVIIAG